MIKTCTIEKGLLKKQTDCFFFNQSGCNHGLTEVEETLKQALTLNNLSKKMICLTLNGIKKSKLYKESGAASFKEYLKLDRIPINYSTAIDYSIIGEMLEKYHTQLEEVGFTEKDGLKKMLVLEKAITKYHVGDSGVFRKLKNSTLSQFQKYAHGPGNETDKKFKDNRFRIKLDDDLIYLSPNQVEVLWLNMELEEELGIPGLRDTLRAHIVASLKKFFNTRIGT